MISSAIADKGYYQFDYYQALNFFYRLPGIRISSQTTYDGFMPDPHTKRDLDHLREWYRYNKDKLCWDQERETAVLCAKVDD